MDWQLQGLKGISIYIFQFFSSLIEHFKKFLKRTQGGGAGRGGGEVKTEILKDLEKWFGPVSTATVPKEKHERPFSLPLKKKQPVLGPIIIMAADNYYTPTKGQALG